ncbi:MAG: cell envelope integrity protein TolA [Deltaproteobacteria bacterium]|nr:cell envelope integrity protein TolA [Deltaproteobacteria bacterium]
MAAGTPTPTISLRERSLPLVGAQEKLSKWLVFSLLLHAGLIAGLFIMPFLPARSAQEYPVYTVDLVGGERIGRTNLGTEMTPAAAPKESAKKTEKEIPPPKSKPEPKKEKVEKTKSVEKTAVIPEKATTKETVKKETAIEKRTETKEAAASLDSVRERLIHSAVERAKNRTDNGPKASKGEVISSGTGEGEGAAALGKGGRGGGVVKGMDFVIYQNRMLSTIKTNWVWVGQRSNLRVVVRFNIKDNGDIVGLKVVQASGNASYDDSVIRAVSKSSPLPAPPEAVRNDFSEVELAFRPEDLGA